ncbi:MAG: M48 family metallopeptidase [Clostridia bacterium]|nr:M48 family metallopeptidase [Clostridia bacterium]
MLQDVKIIRSNRKTLAVAVDLFGRVTVRAPKSCGEARIFAFLKDKESWILSRQAKAQGFIERLPSENLDGFTFLLLGRNCTAKLTDEKRVAFDAQRYIVYLPKNNAKTALVKWLKDNAKRILTEVTARTAERMGITYRSVAITSAKTRWGSCTGDNAIRYTFRLIYAPKEVLEYVVVHELAHVLQKNHSKAFWAVVEKYCPAWKSQRKWLKDNAILIKIL